MTKIHDLKQAAQSLAAGGGEICYALVNYTAVFRMQDILKEADEKVAAIYFGIKNEMENEEREIKTNQMELKSQLQDLVDTEKYLKLIEDRNREIEKEKNEGKPEYEQEKSIYANRQTEVRVNQEYLDKLGLSVADETEKETGAEPEEDDEELKQLEAEIRVNLDADYFQWKEEQDEETHKSGSIQQKLKNLMGGHSHDDSGV